MLCVVGAFHFLLGIKICYHVLSFIFFWPYCVFQGDLLCLQEIGFRVSAGGQIGSACCR